jgi:hypothetical protein
MQNLCISHFRPAFLTAIEGKIKDYKNCKTDLKILVQFKNVDWGHE